MHRFARKHRKGISRVIYFLEHAQHGVLPSIYGRDAYRLLEINDLEPDIGVVERKLYKSGMNLIDVIVKPGEELKEPPLVK